MAGDNINDVVYGEDEELVSQFLTWTEDAIKELRALVSEMPDEITRGEDTVHRIYDLAHNIKGMGASFGFDLLTAISLSLCGYLKGMDDAVLLRRRVFESHIRGFEVVMQHRIKGPGGEQGVALTNRLKDIIREEETS